jgi:hypothetical protein
MIHTDERLLGSPPVSVSCKHCGAKVSARKSSWQQTSIQWDAQATFRCLERRERGADAQQDRELFLACSKLRDSIEDAAHSGAIPIICGAEGALISSQSGMEDVFETGPVSVVEAGCVHIEQDR